MAGSGKTRFHSPKGWFAVINMDRRVLDLETASEEVITSDQKRLVVDAFARYRIKDALRFYQSVGSIPAANLQLTTLLNAALRRVLDDGRPGETYNIGGWNEKANLDVVHTLCALLDELKPAAKSYRELITFVTDRPGHDRRYAIDARKIERELGWRPAETFETGLKKTVQWYLANQDWVRKIQSGEYQQWIHKNYEGRQET